MIQIDMEMPKSCMTCPLCELISYKNYGGFFICPITAKRLVGRYDKTRRKDCPLQEVKE